MREEAGMTRNLWIVVAIIAVVMLVSIALFVFNTGIETSGTTVGP
jgi:uncharacterized membrane protein